MGMTIYGISMEKLTAMDVGHTPGVAYDEGSSTTTTAVLGQLNLDLPNPAGLTRSVWEVRYVTLLVLADLLIGMAAAAAALTLRFGPAANETYNRNYVWLSFALPPAWPVACSWLVDSSTSWPAGLPPLTDSASWTAR